MTTRHGAAMLLLVVVVVVVAVPEMRQQAPASPSDEAAFYLNEWAAHIPGGYAVAERVANELGYVNRGQVSYHKNRIVLKTSTFDEKNLQVGFSLLKKLTETRKNMRKNGPPVFDNAQHVRVCNRSRCLSQYLNILFSISYYNF